MEFFEAKIRGAGWPSVRVEHVIPTEVGKAGIKTEEKHAELVLADCGHWFVQTWGNKIPADRRYKVGDFAGCFLCYQEKKGMSAKVKKSSDGPASRVN